MLSIVAFVLKCTHLIAGGQKEEKERRCRI